MSQDVLDGIHKGLATLEPGELRLIAAAVLHGVPLSRLASASQPQEAMQTTLMAALKKLRQALTDQGLSSTELMRQLR